MLSIKIIATGDLKENYLRDAIKEYQKRLSAWCKIEEIILKEEKLPDNPSQAVIDKALESEEKRILEKISPKAYVIAMCIEGTLVSSEDLAKKLQVDTEVLLKKLQNMGQKVSKGTDMVDENVLKNANKETTYTRLDCNHGISPVLLQGKQTSHNTLPKHDTARTSDTATG